jgi:hypothetical protein
MLRAADVDLPAATVIDVLDAVLRQLFRSQVPGLTSDSQVSFQPPDDDWRATVATLPGNALNVYLADLRENRTLRTNEWQTKVGTAATTREPPPMLVDCHYVITAWSPAVSSPSVEPTVDEHLLLAQTLAVLATNRPLNPSRVYAPDSGALAALPEGIRNADLPSTVVPTEGFLALPYFWGSVGTNSNWKPVIYLVLTMPVLFAAQPAGPPVTTQTLTVGQVNGHNSIPSTAESYRIAGVVQRADGSALSGATVQIERPDRTTVATTTADADGRFVFAGLSAAPFRLRARAAGVGEFARDVEVSPTTKDYDLRFS